MSKFFLDAYCVNSFNFFLAHCFPCFMLPQQLIILSNATLFVVCSLQILCGCVFLHLHLLPLFFYQFFIVSWIICILCLISHLILSSYNYPPLCWNIWTICLRLRMPLSDNFGFFSYLYVFDVLLRLLFLHVNPWHPAEPTFFCFISFKVIQACCLYVFLMCV